MCGLVCFYRPASEGNGRRATGRTGTRQFDDRKKDPWVCLLYDSCLIPARPRASDCSRLVVAVLPAHSVIPSVEHCGVAVLSAFANTTFFVPSVALHVFKVMASCARCLQLAGLQSSSRPGHHCLLGQLSSVRVMFSHHDTDHQDVRVHFAKGQLEQDLCFSSCLKPNPQDRHPCS